jgi:tetratricopeptide (TPR) repeat protein
MEEKIISPLKKKKEKIKERTEPVKEEEKSKVKAGNDPEKKKKIVTALLTVAILLSVVGGGFLVWKFKQKSAPDVQSPKDLVSQYRVQLDDLKKKSESENPQDIQNYAVAQYATGDAQGAEQTYRKQVEKGGDSAMVRNNLGNALRDQKKFDEAIGEYKEAINKDKSLISAYLNMGSVYQYSLQDPSKAIDVYKQGIENNPKTADLYIFLAQAYEQTKDTEAAKSTYKAVLEIQSENAAAKAGLKRLGE